MSLNDTPRANRLHIGIFGRRNAGKSSLINALTGQDLAIVSDTPGTTADPVFKSMELHPIGPVVLIDTAGFDDAGELGELRVAKTADIIARTDVAILVLDGLESVSDSFLKDVEVPVITLINKCDLLTKEQRAAAQAVPGALLVSAKTGEGIEEVRRAIQDVVPEAFLQERLLDGYLPEHNASGVKDPGEEAAEGDACPPVCPLVLLVMPQDIQAPKGRLILPQVQTIRELLDRKCTVVSTTADTLSRTLTVLNHAPDLIITDSQCFADVYARKPAESPLTSFSILMAAAKGDIHVFLEGAAAIDAALAAGSSPFHDDVTAEDSPFRVLIAEACTHVPLSEDIGTVKIPRLLRKSFGDRLQLTSVRGNDFPKTEELKEYDLIIHCGACMFNRRLVMSRIAAAQEAGVPITNYGVFLAKMAGILDQISLPKTV